MIYYQAHIDGTLLTAEHYLNDPIQVQQLAEEILKGDPNGIEVGYWALIRSGGYFFAVKDLFKSPKELVFDSEYPELEFSAWEMARLRAINWAFKKQPKAMREAV